MNVINDKYINDFTYDLYNELGNKSYLNEKKLDILKIENGIVLPPKKSKKDDILFGIGGVVDEKNNYIKESAQLAFGMHNRVNEKYEYDINSIKTVHEKVIYMNFFIKQWGHFLIDVINRLWYILENPNKYKIVYTVYLNEENKISNNYLEFLKMLGIKEENILMINSVTKFDEIIIPEASIMPGKYYTKEYKKIFDKVIESADIPKVNTNKRIYCSRKNYGKTKFKEFGEDIIEENFNKNGFESVFMEKLSLKEQIRLLNQASEIALTCGSLSHNILFIKNKNNVYIINKTYRVNLHQFIINDMSKSNTVFIDAYISPLPILYGYGPFIIKTTKTFLNFMNDYKYNVFIDNSNISIFLKIKYYLTYIYLYRKFIIRMKKIKETDLSKYEVSKSEIRKNYIKFCKEAKK